MILALLIILTGFSAEMPRLHASKEVAFLSMMIAPGSAGRILFAPLPNVSPVDWLTLCTGIIFGSTVGFATGASIMLLSNFWLGQGPWTIYQMVGVGSLGVLGGLLGRRRKRIGGRPLALFGLAWGFAYGALTSFFWMLMVVSVVSWSGFVAYWLSGFAFYLAQGIGNAVFLLVLGERTLRIFERFRLRLEVEFREADQGEVRESDDI